MTPFKFLFYLTPLKYLGLDGEEDPMEDQNYAESVVFEEFLKTCTLKEYVGIIVRIFKIGYPDPASLSNSLGDFEITPNGLRSLGPFRKTDIGSISYVKEEFVNNEGGHDYILKEMTISFLEKVPKLLSWVKEELASVSYIENPIDNFSVLSGFSNGALSEIWCGDKELIIKTNLDSYVHYFR